MVTRVERLEQKFVDYSNRVQDLLFFVKDGLTKNIGYDDLVEMKKGLLLDTKRVIALDQERMQLTRDPCPHPNYEQFMTYRGVVNRLLEIDLLDKL